jgi:hypothetical protein
MADAPNCGAEEKIGHSGRDDSASKPKNNQTQERRRKEHSPFDSAQGRQEWLCHREWLRGRAGDGDGESERVAEEDGAGIWNDGDGDLRWRRSYRAAATAAASGQGESKGEE